MKINANIKVRHYLLFITIIMRVSLDIEYAEYSDAVTELNDLQKPL